MKTVLLRLASTGEPAATTDGTLSLPAAPLPEGYAPGDVIYTVKLSISALAAIARGGVVWTNAPPAGVPFDRLEFYRHPITSSFSQDSIIDIEVFAPGSYCYYVTYQADKPVTTQKYYFTAPCALSINGTYLPFNAISMETVVNKWIGDWPAVFTEVARKGYNMIHFTPLNARGDSDSPYSIRDQLSFDSFFADEAAVKAMVNELEHTHGILSLTDIVLNHTANNSEWLREHPDAGYNARTAPHLESAIALDAELLAFSANLEELGYPTDPQTDADILRLMEGIRTHVLEKLRLWEYYTLDVAQAVSLVEAATPGEVEVPEAVRSNLSRLAEWVAETEQPFVLGGRYAHSLNWDRVAGILRVADFSAKALVDELNVPLYRVYNEDLTALTASVESRIRFLRLDGNGPRQGPITLKLPLTEPYFTRFSVKGEPYALANNGWIWGGNPLVDFASNQSRAYIRREVIVWGDCVKLRYGSGPEDSPYLWSRMMEYTRLCARVFHGLRIDNAHSTPIHVAEAMLDVARAVNPHVYVVAELFTGSEELDRMFVERLGLSSLIREAMQAWSVEELSRLVHKHGGRPIGSFDALTEQELVPTPVHALFMDCSHDNEMPAQKRTVEDTLPNAALVSLCACAVGSVFGYDECYPALLDVVSEKGIYTWGKGIGSVKRQLLDARAEASYQSVDAPEDNEMYIHHEDQYITVHRTNSRTGKGLFLVARTKFHAAGNQLLAPVVLSGEVSEMFAYKLVRTGDAATVAGDLSSIPVELVALKVAISYDPTTNQSTVTLPQDFPQGSIAVMSTAIPEVNAALDAFLAEGSDAAVSAVTLVDVNALLYRCDQEEQDASSGSGVYHIPGHGLLVYAGLQGWMSVLEPIIAQNDLAHPLLEHLRQGQWALDYILNRLAFYPSKGVDSFGLWLRERFEAIRKLPYFLLPRYFALTVGIAFGALRRRGLLLLPKELSTATSFVQDLAMCLIQMVGSMNSTSVLPFTNVPCMAAGLPHFSVNYMRCWGRDVFISLRGLLLATGRFEDAKTHLLGFAATLKHGLIPNLLDAGRNPRYNARDAAWFFVQSVQDYVESAPQGHLLLKELVKRRFPLDDTYCTFDSPEAFAYSSTVAEVVYEILARHARGIEFREANAGPQLDSQMKDQGFNVKVGVDWSTGLIHGGSEWNCGTWMDKMGESERAGSKGVPGTSRDGANVEINGLLKSCLRFVNQLHTQGRFEPTLVHKPDGLVVMLVEWEEMVQANFETKFYVPVDLADDDKFDIQPALVNRRGIYKDTYRTTKAYEEYQLRPNFPIAMCVAPELFTPLRALQALRVADTVLRGPVGMRTLDPSDYNYRPYYNNAEDSSDFATSKGRNYHQGPEWVWCMGYFLRAFATFSLKEDPKCTEDGGPSTYLYLMLASRMAGHRKWISESEWRGLTELSNKDGAVCGDSSPTQAWSSACLLDLYYDMDRARA